MDSVAGALFALGRVYQEGLPDYPSAIAAYDSLLRLMPATPLREETLLGLYYCYKKMGDGANADKIVQMMRGEFPKGKFTALAVNPDSVAEAAGAARINATRQYDRIYDAFIEGRFDEAMTEKKLADSLYGDKYWTPQLLYIEAVYLIRSRQDAQARSILGNIQMKFPKTPMADKAARLIDVLGRRRQIETYLTNLKVERAVDTLVLTGVQPVITPTRPPEPGPRTVTPQQRRCW